MTTPAGVPNLPAGALTVAQLGSQLQDQSAGAYRGRAAGRMPELFSTSNGGDPLSNISPFGVLTRVFSEVVSLVATADPADIQGPDDIPDLLTDFVRRLPVVGELMGLLDAILGTYTGNDDTLIAIQEIFWPIRKLMQLISGQDIGWPTMDEITRGWKRLLDNTVSAIEALLKSIWDGVGGLGDWIAGVFDPEKAKKAMEETQARIAAAVAAIIAQGGVVERFGEYPAGKDLGPRWTRSRVGGNSGTLGIRDGLLKIVDDVGFGGTRWRAVHVDKESATPDMRVDAVFATVPGLASGAENRILACCNADGSEHAYAQLMNGKFIIGVNVGGRTTIVKPQTALRFQPTATYSLIRKGSTLELWENARLVTSAVDSRVGQLTGKRMGYEVFEPLSVDRAGGLAALGFRSMANQLLLSEEGIMSDAEALALSESTGYSVEQVREILAAHEQLREGPPVGTILRDESGQVAIRDTDERGLPVWTVVNPHGRGAPWTQTDPAPPDGFTAETSSSSTTTEGK